jgi:glutamate/tyrosine decarboxylase-like PLP-dependent enzyme
MDLGPEEFRALAHALVDALSDFRANLPHRPVSSPKAPTEVHALLDPSGIPESGDDSRRLLLDVLPLLVDNQTFNGHPRFWGYITASPAPIGVLADLIVSTLNPNLGLWQMSPIATEIEAQTAAWIAELIGFPTTGRGVMTSGGQQANHVGVLVARWAMAPWDVRARGASDGSGHRLRLYTSSETHGWVKQAADLFGLGTDAIRWIPTAADQAMEIDALRAAIRDDRARGDLPMMVIGTAGSVGSGAIDPLPEIAALCREEAIWFHVDGAYGACAAALPDAPPRLRGIREADSVAVDPHKWLYAPLDAGCTLVRDPEALRNAFGTQASYYVLDGDEDAPVNLFELGPENSRRFRALKVWLALRQIGASGYRQLIAEDIALARYLFELVAAHPALEAMTQGLSVTTFRYLPADMRAEPDAHLDYLNRLNRAVLRRIQRDGHIFLSNTTVRGAFLLRACIVNFRTTAADIEIVPNLVERIGAEADKELRASMSVWPSIAG